MQVTASLALEDFTGQNILLEMY